MSADPFVEPSATPPLSAADNGAKPGNAVTSQVAEMLKGLVRLADLQVTIWLSTIKATVLQIVCVACLCTLALLATTVAILFLYAGIFHLMTDYLHVPTAWGLLIFAGVHGLMAGALVIAAILMLNRRQSQKTTRGDVS